MATLTIVWTYVKRYWSIAVLIVGGVVAFFVLRRRETSFIDEYERITATHEAELKRIADARAEEQRAHEANVLRMQKTLDAIQKRYDEAQETLDSRKKREVESIVKRYSSDPDVLASKLAEATGFKIIMPEGT